MASYLELLAASILPLKEWAETKPDKLFAHDALPWRVRAEIPLMLARLGLSPLPIDSVWCATIENRRVAIARAVRPVGLVTNGIISPVGELHQKGLRLNHALARG